MKTIFLLLFTALCSAQTHFDIQLGYPFVELPPPGARLATNVGISHYFKVRDTRLGLKAGSYTVQITGSDLRSIDLMALYIPFDNLEVAMGANMDRDNGRKYFQMEATGTIPFVEHVDFTITATNVFIATRNVLGITVGVRFRLVGNQLFGRYRGNGRMRWF